MGGSEPDLEATYADASWGDAEPQMMVTNEPALIAMVCKAAECDADEAAKRIRNSPHVTFMGDGLVMVTREPRMEPDER